MSMLNLLQAAISGLKPPGAEDEGTEVDPLVVTAAKRESAPQHEQPVEYNYNNTNASKAVNNAVAAEGTPRGGSANPGLYGLLPERMQHGTLRNVLGAIGDAFLVQSGHEPQYRQRMERQQIGNALAGYDPENPASMQAALQRLAVTGAPGSIEMVQSMQKDAGSREDRKASREQTAQYRQSSVDSRNQNTFTRQMPMAQGMVSAAKDVDDYKKRYEILDRRAKSIDPDIDASEAYGIPYPEDWHDTPGYGMTSNQQVQSSDRAAGRKTSERNTDVRADTSIKVAGIGANARVTAAGISGDKATNAVMVQNLIAKQNRGETLTPAEQRFFDKETNIPGRHRRGVPAAAKAPAKAPAASNKPTNRDVSILKAHPEHRAAFDAKFGKGAAAKFLGK